MSNGRSRGFKSPKIRNRPSSRKQLPVNCFKLYYFRREKKLSVQKLADAVGIPKRTLMVLEAGIAPTGGPPRQLTEFAETDTATIRKLESILGLPTGILAVGTDDFASLYINYYNQSRKKKSAEYLQTPPQPQSSLFLTRAILFDFDGTLTRRDSLTRTTWERLWIALGYVSGECGRLELKHISGEISHDRWCDITLEHFRDRGLTETQVREVGRQIELVDGLEHTLRYLKSKGIKCYILSGSIWQIIHEVLGEELLDMFDDIRVNLFSFDRNGIIDRIAGTKYDFKDKATYVNDLISEHNFAPDELLFVGNSYNDTFVKKLTSIRTLLVNPEGTHPGNTEAWDYYEPALTSIADILNYVRVPDDGSSDNDVFANALHLLEPSEVFSLTQYKVVGDYLRYQKDDREALIALADRIKKPCLEKVNTWENFLICASPGSGKTYFIEQLHKSLAPHGIDLHSIDVSRDDETAIQDTLNRIQSENKPCLCLIDEIDGKVDAKWVYDVTYKYLDLNKDPNRSQSVFVLVGSGTGKLTDLINTISKRPKGLDLLDRIPDSVEYRFSLPSQTLGDKLIGFISKIKFLRPDITRIEKFALYYVLGTYGLKSPRQISALAERSTQSVRPGESVLRLEHLINAGTGERDSFVKIHHSAFTSMGTHLLSLE